jgi:uncharacterized membrane protein YbhN (UPF0104 family)
VRVPALRWIRFVVGLAIALVCLWLALRHIRVNSVMATMRHIQWAWIGIALAALGAGYAARIHRWWWMLRQNNPSLTVRRCAWPLIVGFAVNNIVPFRAGDALRVVSFRGQLGITAVRLLGSLLIERILDLTILLAFLLMGIVGLNRSEIPAMYVRTAELVAGIGIVAWALLLVMSDQLKAIFLRFCRYRALAARGWTPQAEEQIQQLFVALSIVRMPDRAAKLITMSAIVWSCEGSVFAAVARGIHYDGQDFGPWFSLATGSLSTLIPSSPGYVGTFEFFTISGLTAYGASASVAAATAFIVHAVLWLPLTAIGVTYLLLTYLTGRGIKFVASPVQGQERM